VVSPEGGAKSGAPTETSVGITTHIDPPDLSAIVGFGKAFHILPGWPLPQWQRRSRENENAPLACQD